VGIKHAYVDVWNEWVRQMQRRGIEITNAKEMVKVMGMEAKEEKGGTELVQVFLWLTRRVVESA
jgi:hypothetical protein